MDRQLGSALAALRDAADSVRCSGEVLDLGPCVEAFAELCQGLFSDEGMSFAIAIVFDEENGLFGIVESLVTLRDRSVAEAREQCWPLVELIGSRALPYAPLWKEKCLLYFRRDDAKGVQAAALTPLVALLESNMTQSKAATFEVNQELSDILVREFQKPKGSDTCKANLLQLLGDFVEYSKETFEEENVLAILELCLDTLDEQLHGKKPVMVVMAGAVKCLNSLLTWFDDSLPAGGSVEISRKAFTYMEQILLPPEELKRCEPLKGS